MTAAPAVELRMAVDEHPPENVTLEVFDDQGTQVPRRPSGG